LCGKVGPDEVDVSDGLRNAGLVVVQIDTLQRELRPLSDLVSLFRLITFFRQWKPDIVETHTAKAGTLGRLAALFAGVPVRLHVFHGHIFEGFFPPRKARIFLEIERVLARITTRIIALGEHQRSDLLSRGIGKNRQVLSIPLGFNLDRFSSIPVESELIGTGPLRRELGVENVEKAVTPIIGMIARLVPTKAHEVFLEAAELILHTIPGAQFVIVGDGECRKKLEETARTHPSGKRMHFLGWRTDTPELYAEIDLIMHTSDSEGMPVAIIEALASGIPVVATAVGGVPDLIQDGTNGHLVPPRNPQAIANAVLSILSDPSKWAQMRSAARKSVTPRHTVETLTGNMTRLYKSLVPNPAAL
jgi:glycosyltransferase involved in cell wall biosynthesis